MSCEVWTTKGTYICSVALRSKKELQEHIRECEDIIKDCKERLKALVYMTEPKKFYPEEDTQFYLNRDFEEIFEEYDEARIKLTRLWSFEECWDKTHDEETGKAILPVNPLDLKKLDDKVYMGGDYCEYILEDGSEMPDDWWDVYNGWVNPEDCSFADRLGYAPKKIKRDIDIENMSMDELHKRMMEQLNNLNINVPYNFHTGVTNTDEV